MTHKNSIRPNSSRSRDCILYVYDMTHEIGKDRILAKTVYMTDKNSIRPYSLRYRDCLLYVYDMTHETGKDRILYAPDYCIVYALEIVYYMFVT